MFFDVPSGYLLIFNLVLIIKITFRANLKRMFPGFKWGVALFGVACFVEHFVERANANERKVSGNHH